MSSRKTLPALPSPFRPALTLEGLSRVQDLGQFHGRLFAGGDFWATSYSRFQTGFKMSARSVSHPSLTHSPSLAFVPRSGQPRPSEVLHAKCLVLLLVVHLPFVPRFRPSLLHIWIIATAS